METISDEIERFLSRNSGSGAGTVIYSQSDDSGFGYGSGSGSGYGHDYGSGYGAGSGAGSGYGDGHGSGAGYGEGAGSGASDGYGGGDDYGLKSFNGMPVNYVDRIATVIERVWANCGRGFVVNADLTTTPCWIAKQGNYFAHGATIREAVQEAVAKFINSRPIEERIDEFVKFHPDLDETYGDLFEWHYLLTGSCKMGREQWCKDHGYKPTDEMLLRDFLTMTQSTYGGDVIKQVSDRYNFN